MEENQTNEEKTFTLEEVDQIKSEFNDKYLRLLAEFDNYKKRVKKEKEDIKDKVKSEMLSSVMDIDSDIAIALKNVEDEGILLIAKKLEKFLESHEIKPIQTETYDTELHDVISVIDVGEQKIVDVINKGYTLNDKPIRYPKIILGK